MSTSRQNLWNQVKEDLIMWQDNLSLCLANKMYTSEEVDEGLKDGLRFATYLRFLVNFRKYPDVIGLAIDKAREIETVFSLAGYQFKPEHLVNIRIKILELEDSLWGNQTVLTSIFIPAILSQPDPAFEHEGTWVMRVFQHYVV